MDESGASPGCHGENLKRSGLRPISTFTKAFADTKPAEAARSVLLAAALLTAAFATPASAATLVGDPGSRSLTVQSSQLTSGQFIVSQPDPQSAVSIDVAADGTFSVPAGVFVWPGGVQSAQASVSSGCGSSPINIGAFTQGFTFAASDASPGVVDPGAGTAHIGVDAVLTANTINIPLSQSASLCAASSRNATLSCSFPTLPVHLDLDGDAAHLSDVTAGNLALKDASVSFALAPSCSGATAFNDVMAEILSWLGDFYSPAQGSLDVAAQMSPGAHAPVPPAFQGTASLGGTPTVASTLTCAPPSATGLPAPTVTIDWTRDGTAIPGAGGATYVVQPDDGGHSLACRAHAVNAVGSADSASGGAAIPTSPSDAGSSAAGNPLAPADPLAGGSTQAPTALAPRCVVPKLKGLTMAAAKRKLAKSHCTAATNAKRVKAKNVKHGRVAGSKPGAGTRKRAGFRVALLVAR